MIAATQTIHDLAREIAADPRERALLARQMRPQAGPVPEAFSGRHRRPKVDGAVRVARATLLPGSPKATGSDQTVAGPATVTSTSHRTDCDGYHGGRHQNATVIDRRYTKRRRRNLALLRAALDALARETVVFESWSVEDLRGPRRVAPLCRVRGKFIRRARAAGHTFADLGRYLRRDHTSVLAAYRRAAP